MTWYGLTREEAQAFCESRGLLPRFTLTRDPKAAPEDATAVQRVIRAEVAEGEATILLGLFAAPNIGR